MVRLVALSHTSVHSSTIFSAGTNLLIHDILVTAMVGEHKVLHQQDIIATLQGKTSMICTQIHRHKSALVLPLFILFMSFLSIEHVCLTQALAKPCGVKASIQSSIFAWTLNGMLVAPTSDTSVWLGRVSSASHSWCCFWCWWQRAWYSSSYGCFIFMLFFCSHFN